MPRRVSASRCCIATPTVTTSTTDACTSPTSTQSATPAGCTNVAKPAPKKDGGQKKPNAPLASGKTYRLTFQTNCGSFTVQLDTKSAPNASASMVSLANAGFFSGT